MISHFILRLAFCGQQHRSWLITQECLLLEYRLSSLGTKIPEFFAEVKFGFDLVCLLIFFVSLEQFELPSDFRGAIRSSRGTAQVGVF